jgi:RNA polymerase sigma factor (sigma-70 family)
MVMSDSDQSDQQLWSRAQAGDAEAFGVLYERHVRAVYTFCFWRTADAVLAEDLSAAVFVEVWAARARTPVLEASVLSWLLGVAHNMLRNQWRSARRRRAALRRLPPLRDAPDHAERVAERLDAERRMRSVRQVLAGLSDNDRAVLELCGWAGLSAAEAAAVLGVAVGTVHSRLHRARAKLQALSQALSEEASVRGGHQSVDDTASSRPEQEICDGA